MSRRALHIVLGLVALACGGAFASTADGQTWRTMTSARQVADRSPLAVDIAFGAGTLRVHPVESPLLYQMEIRYDADLFTPKATLDNDRRRLELGVRSSDGEGRMRSIREGSAATIGLSREVPMELDLNFAAGKAEIELGGMAIRGLKLATGASETTVSFSEPNLDRAERVSIEAGAADLRVVGLGNARADRITFQGGVGGTVLDFGGSWDRSADVTVQMGIGSITLRIPRDLGVRVSRSSFLTTFNAPGLNRQGNAYVNDAWDRADLRLNIDLSAAFGSIEIVWID